MVGADRVRELFGGCFRKSGLRRWEGLPAKKPRRRSILFQRAWVAREHASPWSTGHFAANRPHRRSVDLVLDLILNAVECLGI
jgi:hypothetical protein